MIFLHRSSNLIQNFKKIGGRRMAFHNETEIDAEQLKSFLKDSLDKVMTQENPDILNEIKKIFKQTIPFSKRMYVAAFLAKDASQKNHRTFSGKRNFQNQKKSLSNSENNGEVQRERVTIADTDSATIFLSIGRNRRVYPRDLVGILTNVAQIGHDRIGDIRVLSNYSFVQLFKADAQKAIDALNGYDYRGRKLAVSYSHGKSEEMSAPASTENASESGSQYLV